MMAVSFICVVLFWLSICLHAVKIFSSRLTILVSEGMQRGLFADFLQEANNAERTAKSFAHKKGILVPRVVKVCDTQDFKHRPHMPKNRSV
jgi:hypothetical protein